MEIPLYTKPPNFWDCEFLRCLMARPVETENLAGGPPATLEPTEQTPKFEVKLNGLKMALSKDMSDRLLQKSIVSG